MNYENFAIGWIIGFAVSQFVYHRGLAVKFLATLVLVLASDAAAAEQSTFRDANGRVTGRAVTDSQGSTVFRDANGQTTGRSSVDSQGTTTYYGPDGRKVGSESGTDLRKSHVCPVKSPCWNTGVK